MRAYSRISLGRDSSGRPLVINRRTQQMLAAAEAKLGHRLTLVQGSYRSGAGAAASAGTHDGGGVVDIRTWDLPAGSTPADVVKALRQVGFAAWHRTPAQGFDAHIHAVAIGDKDLAPSAARQVQAYRDGRNGLANNRPDDGPRVPFRTWEQVKRRRPPSLRRRGKRHPYWTAELQRELGIRVDGLYGPRTARAVKAFRRRHRIRPYTGAAGRRVWNVLRGR